MTASPRKFFLILLATSHVFHCGTNARAADAPPKIPILFDTDIGTGIDDPLALALILTSPEIDLRGVTTSGGSAEDRAWIVCRFLTHLDRKDVPVAFGRVPQPDEKIDWQIQYRRHPAVVWDRTAKPVKQPAVELMYEKLKADPGKITLVAAGPLTNINRLLEEHPDCKPWIKRIVIASKEKDVIKGFEGEIAEPKADDLRLYKDQLQRLFEAYTPLTYQVENLYELWDQPTAPSLGSAMAVASVISADISPSDFPGWYVKRVAGFGRMTLPKAPGNNSKLIPRGRFPNKVHVVEDYETDIEKRWWMTGKLETKDVRPGGESKRVCRAVLTQDYDDLQGDPKAFYRAVVFNPVPGPPMGKNTRLAFRFKLHGTDTIRVQLFSLSVGYHRYLSVKNLPQDTWMTTAVDMTQMRRPDGTGGPLSEKEEERIDDIQFYIDPRAELLIDDVILYDAAADDEKRLFPKHIVFTAGFDTGKQGAEWPGKFEIVPHEKPLQWNAAKAIAGSMGNMLASIGMRGLRSLPSQCRLRFRYKLDRANEIQLAINAGDSNAGRSATARGLSNGKWAEADVPLDGKKIDAADRIEFIAPPGSTLLLDDVTLYEPGD